MATQQMEDLEDKYTVYPKKVRDQIDRLPKMFEKKTDATPQPEPQPEPSPEPEPQPEPQPEPSAEMVPKAELDRSDQRYRTLQEKYNKEVPELIQQNKFLFTEYQTLQNQIQSLRAVQEKKPETKKVSLREKPHIQKLKDDLAPDAYESFVGALEETFEEIENRHQEDIKTLRGEVTNTVAKTRQEAKQESFWDAVNSVHSDYERIKENPEFQTFLSESEGLSGYTKYDFFVNAFNRGDSKTFIKYLDAFRGTDSPKKELTQGSPNPDKLKNRVAAPRGTGGGGGTGSSKPEMTVDEARIKLKALQEESGRGLWEGRDEEFDKEYARLFKLASPPRSG